MGSPTADHTLLSKSRRKSDLAKQTTGNIEASTQGDLEALRRRESASFRRISLWVFAKSACGYSTGLDQDLQSDPVRERSSLTLDRADILRATTPSTLLSGFGSRLRSTTGGIGQTTTEDDYKKSFPVETLDIFLSHSWHAWWLLKYWTLLLYFNVLPAMFFALSAGLAVDTLRRLIADKQATEFTELRLTSLFVGGIVFNIVLFTWQRIRPFRGKTLFLDKVCIHQTNQELKVLGIKSIGAFLANTQTVLIAWDKTYLERLWCVYELAAFKCRQPKGRIILLPIMLGPIIALFSAMSMSGKVLSFICVSANHNTTRQRMITDISPSPKGTELEAEYAQYRDLCWYFWGVGLFCLTPFARRYGYSLTDLYHQLDGFSADSAKCYCCCNNHKHPDTGEGLPCDRELVYESIAHWHGGDDRVVGLQKFNELVRTSLRRDIQQTLGGWSLVPYTLALSCSFWDGLIGLGMLKTSDYTEFWNLFPVLSRIFITGPCSLAFAIGVGVRFPIDVEADPLSSRRVALIMTMLPPSLSRTIVILNETIENILIIFVLLFLEKLHSDLRETMSRSQSPWQLVTISLIEIVLPFFFFSATVFVHCARAFAHLRPQWTTDAGSSRCFAAFDPGSRGTASRAPVEIELASAGEHFQRRCLSRIEEHSIDEPQPWDCDALVQSTVGDGSFDREVPEDVSLSC